ncbi:MAG: hypothetical protein ABIQ99_04970, partial [Thermoflexales bacterium]
QTRSAQPAAREARTSRAVANVNKNVSREAAMVDKKESHAKPRTWTRKNLTRSREGAKNSLFFRGSAASRETESRFA